MILLPLVVDYNSREVAVKRPRSRSSRPLTLRVALAFASIASVLAAFLYVVWR